MLKVCDRYISPTGIVKKSQVQSTHSDLEKDLRDLVQKSVLQGNLEMGSSEASEIVLR